MPRPSLSTTNAVQSQQYHRFLSPIGHSQPCLNLQRASQSDLIDAQTDRTLQLRLENARLSRAEATLRAKGSSLEAALRALEGRLAEQEDRALAQHAALEYGKYQAIIADLFLAGDPT